MESKLTPLLLWLSNSYYLYSLSLELTARLEMFPLKTRYQKQEVKTKATKTGVTDKIMLNHCNDTFREISFTAEYMKLFLKLRKLLHRSYLTIRKFRGKFKFALHYKIDMYWLKIYTTRAYKLHSSKVRTIWKKFLNITRSLNS